MNHASVDEYYDSSREVSLAISWNKVCYIFPAVLSFFCDYSMTRIYRGVFPNGNDNFRDALV